MHVSRLSLDSSFVNASIRGPPGTGKTYVGVQIVRCLLHNTRNSDAPAGGEGASKPDVGPILCVCLTNHALDQFLEALLDAGVAAPGCGALVRFGGRSQSARLEAHNLLSLVALPGARTKAQGGILYGAMAKLRSLDQKSARGGCILLWTDVAHVVLLTRAHLQWRPAAGWRARPALVRCACLTSIRFSSSRFRPRGARLRRRRSRPTTGRGDGSAPTPRVRVVFDGRQPADDRSFSLC